MAETATVTVQIRLDPGGRAARSVRVIERGIERTKRDVVDLGRRFRNSVNRRIDQAGRKVRNLGNDFNRFLRSQAGQLAAMAGGFLGIQAAVNLVNLGLRSMLDFLRSITREIPQMVDKLAKDSRRLGIAVEDLSSFRLAAQLAGTDIDTVGKGLQRLNRVAFDASVGLLSAKRAFDVLGISVKGGNGQLLKSEELMLLVSERFSQMEDGTLKSALAQQILGRAGAQLIPLLNQGAAGLQQQVELARRLGIVIDQETAAKMERLNDQITVLNFAWEGFKLRVAERVVPALNRLLDVVLENEEGLKVLMVAAEVTGRGLVFVGAQIVGSIELQVAALQTLLQFLDDGRLRAVVTILAAMPGPLQQNAQLAKSMLDAVAGRGSLLDESREGLKNLREDLVKLALDFNKAGGSGKRNFQAVVSGAEEASRAIADLRQEVLAALPVLERHLQQQRELAEEARRRQFLTPANQSVPGALPENFGRNFLPRPDIFANQDQVLLDNGQLNPFFGSEADFIQQERMVVMLELMRQVREGTLAMHEVMGRTPPELFPGLEIGIEKIRALEDTINSAGQAFVSGFAIVAQGIRQGGFQAVAALGRVFGPMVFRYGQHLLHRGIFEVALGSSPPPLGPNPALIAHGSTLKVLGGILSGVGIAGIAAGFAGQAASAAGIGGGAPGSAGNPVNVQPSPLTQPGTFNQGLLPPASAPVQTPAPPAGSGDLAGRVQAGVAAALRDHLTTEAPGVVVTRGIGDNGGVVNSTSSEDAGDLRDGALGGDFA